MIINYKNKVIKVISDFFIENENYKVYKSQVNKHIIYLHNVNKEFQLIEIKDKVLSKIDNIEELNYIETNLIKNTNKKIKKLSIILSSDTHEFKDIKNKKNEVLIVCDIETLNVYLGKYIPKALNYNFKEELEVVTKTKSIDISQKEYSELSDQEKLNFNTRIKKAFITNKLYLFWLTSILFVVMPLLLTSIFLFLPFPSNPSFDGTNRAALIPYLLGGSTYVLNVLASQFWRILTYGFGMHIMNLPNGEILFSIIFSYLIFLVFAFSLMRLVRTSEIVVSKPWKVIAPFVITYPLVGLVGPLISPTIIISGIVPILGIVIGILVGTTWDSETFLSGVAKKSLLLPLFLVVFFSIFISTNGLMELVIFGFAFVFACSTALLINKKFIDWNNLQWLSIILIVMLIVLPLIIYATTYTTIPPINLNVVRTLVFYNYSKLIPLESVNAIFENQIGWNVTINQAGNILFWVR